MRSCPLFLNRHRWLIFVVLGIFYVTSRINALERTFHHKFIYDPINVTVGNTTQQVQRLSDATSVRWNTKTLISGFGMEKGGMVELEIQQVTSHNSTPVPVVFTLYNHDQWRVYSVLQLRDMPLRSPRILCHYPSYMRHTVLQVEDKLDKIQVNIEDASLYTLQAQVCGDATVSIKVGIELQSCFLYVHVSEYFFSSGFCSSRKLRCFFPFGRTPRNSKVRTHSIV
jgi:hypothetical protein